MLLTTTNDVKGKNISTYYGMVTGEAIIGANIFKDIFASITDIVGGRSGAYEKSLKDAKNIAVQEMIEAAHAMGANAIVAIDLDGGRFEPGFFSGTFCIPFVVGRVWVI